MGRSRFHSLVRCRASLVLLACASLAASSLGQSPPPPPAVNGYKVTYTGGTFTYREMGTTIDQTFGYALGSDGRYGGGSGNASSVSCSGTITAKFEWKGAGPAPKVVVIEETCLANAENRWGEGAYDNGLGSGSGADSAGHPIPHFVVKTNPGASFSVQCTPSASVSGPDSNAGVGYAATPTPVSLTLQNTVARSDGSLNCMIGTAVQGGLNAGGYTKSDYSWTVSGDKFASFFATASAGHPVAFDAAGLTTATPVWRWEELADGASSEHPETVTCTATLASGSYSVGTVTVTQPVSVWTPYARYETHIQGFFSASGVAFYDSYLSTSSVTTRKANDEGVSYYAFLGTPEFTTVGQGQFVQLIQLYRSVGYPFPQTGSILLTNGFVLDNFYPYPYQTPPPFPADSTTSLPTHAWFYDAPSNGISGATQYQFHDSFKMYVMFKPAVAGDWCNLALCQWNWHAEASAPWTFGSALSVPGSLVTKTSFAPDMAHPVWSEAFKNTP